MADFATVEDLNARLLDRDLTEAETAKAPTLLADASAIMREAFPHLDANPPATARGVCCAMVLRVIRNPGGHREEAVDDYRYVIDSTQSTGALYLSDAEAAMLRPPGRGGSAFTITPTAPPCPPVVA